MFASDRDILIIEPWVFRDAGWLGQRVCSGTAAVSGTTLTLTGLDVGLDAAGVTAGHVVVIDGVGYEVVARTGATTATISRARAGAGGAAIPVGALTGRPASVWTFGPQIALAHAAVLRLIGVEPGVVAMPNAEGRVGENAVLNGAELATAEALGALMIIHAALAAGGAASSGGRGGGMERAEWYRRRFEEERRRVTVLIDLDGDGRADARRSARVVAREQ